MNGRQKSLFIRAADSFKPRRHSPFRHPIDGTRRGLVDATPSPSFYLKHIFSAFSNIFYIKWPKYSKEENKEDK